MYQPASELLLKSCGQNSAHPILAIPVVRVAQQNTTGIQFRFDLGSVLHHLHGKIKHTLNEINEKKQQLQIKGFGDKQILF